MKVYVVLTSVQTEPTPHVYGVYNSYQTAYGVERDIHKFYARIYGHGEDIKVWIEEAKVEED